MANRLPDRDQLASAIYITNKHAKTAPDNEFLYRLKKGALEKMISDGLAEKTGLQFVRNPKFSQQQSAVLITCGHFHFHLPATREELKTLPHLGEPDPDYRNPKVRLGLKTAKQILQDYTGIRSVNSTNKASSLDPQTRNRAAHSIKGTEIPSKKNGPQGHRVPPKPSNRHRSWFDQ